MLQAKGQDVERRVLAQAVRWHTEHRVLLNGHRTVASPERATDLLEKPKKARRLRAFSGREARAPGRPEQEISRTGSGDPWGVVSVV